MRKERSTGMAKRKPKRFDPGSTDRQLLESHLELSHGLMRLGAMGKHLTSIVPDVLKLFLEYSGSDEVDLELSDGGRQTRWRGTWRDGRFFRFETLPRSPADAPSPASESGLLRLRRIVLDGKGDSTLPYFTAGGSFWTPDAGSLSMYLPEGRVRRRESVLRLPGDFLSLALFPVRSGLETVGILQMACRDRGLLTLPEVGFYESVTQTLGIILRNIKVQTELGERLKELTCLYGITRLVEESGRKIDDLLQGVAELLPPAWQYPDITSASIELDGRTYATPGFRPGMHGLSAGIVIDGAHRGTIEVAYTRKMPFLDEGPFLKEERSLIDAVAGQIALIIEQRAAEEDKVFLQNRLRHADRLATIGQLAAGVAHELNEPLSNILGFAQLTQKCPGLPSESNRDLEKIIGASLHSREIVKKLLMFARQTPQKRSNVQLNRVVEDVVYLFEGRCRKSGIELVLDLAPDLPEIVADHIQMNQVLVNLLTNGTQAAGNGDSVTVQTRAHSEGVELVVVDTGRGIDDEVLQNIFDPFFTTKDPGEGTGLGLSVVRDIVTAHGGDIQVTSSVGQGSRFEVRLPFREPRREECDDERE